MGSVINSIFGGSSKKEQSTQESGNKFADNILGAFGPSMQLTGMGGGLLGQLLGLGGGDSAAAQSNFRNTPGYQFTLGEGMKAVNSKYGAAGLGNSGPAMKGTASYASGLADQTYQNYIQNLLGLTNVGTQAGQLVSNAGQYSKGQSTGSGSESSGGLGKAIGVGLSMISDRRLKKNIKTIGLHEGLPVYEYSYIWNDVRHVGVMAQDVFDVMPKALGPTVNGYMTVDYGKIPNWETR